MVLSFHPERSQPKVDFLLAQAAQSATCPVSNPPPMAMIINIPERALLIKVTRVADGAQRPQGYTLVFYDITDVISAQAAAAPAAGGPASAPPATLSTLVPSAGKSLLPVAKQSQWHRTLLKHKTRSESSSDHRRKASKHSPTTQTKHSDKHKTKHSQLHQLLEPLEKQPG
jgi:hypothetical protein